LIIDLMTHHEVLSSQKLPFLSDISASPSGNLGFFFCFSHLSLLSSF